MQRFLVGFIVVVGLVTSATSMADDSLGNQVFRLANPGTPANIYSAGAPARLAFQREQLDIQRERLNLDRQRLELERIEIEAQQAEQTESSPPKSNWWVTSNDTCIPAPSNSTMRDFLTAMVQSNQKYEMVHVTKHGDFYAIMQTPSNNLFVWAESYDDCVSGQKTVVSASAAAKKKRTGVR